MLLKTDIRGKMVEMGPKQRDRIIGNSAFIGKVIHSPLEIQYQIDKLERFFSLVEQLVCGAFITSALSPH